MWLRRIFVIFNVALWILFIRLALHRSRYPVFLGRYSTPYLTLLVLVLGIAVALSLMNLGNVYSHLDRKRYQLLWALVLSPILALVMAEGLLRGFNLFGSSLYGEFARYIAVLVPDERVVYKNPSNHRGIYQGVEIATNELGFRNRPLSPKSPDQRRILFLGDSVTFGWGVRGEDTFCSQLELDLRRKGLNVEAINSGVSGYNTYQELGVLEKYGDLLKPDLVVLVYVDNDVDPEANPTAASERRMPEPWRNPFGSMAYLIRKTRLYMMVLHLGPVLVSGVGTSIDRGSPGWQRSMDSLLQMAAYCETRKIAFITFHFRMLPNPQSDALNTEISAIAERQHFQFGDVLPWFEHKNVDRLTNSFIDSHPNAEGHRILADGMARFLLDAPGLGLR
jgi:lysophospholipase L1-like esterase